MRIWLYSVVPSVLLAASAAAAQQAPSGDQMVEQLLREPPAAEQPAEADCSTEEAREKNTACWQSVQGDSRGFSLAAPAAGATAQKKWQKVQGAERGFSLGSKAAPASRGTSGTRAPASGTARASARPAQRPVQVASTRPPVKSYAAAAASCAADEVSGSGLNLCATFNLGSATLTERTRKTLDELAAKLTSDPRLASRRFVISGHADASGDAGRNQALSRQRAQAVVDYLASRGVPAVRLTAEGRGAEEPINGRDPSDPMNRRVQIRASS
ncbi:MAG TPA: OmpA family protein [Caulobacteraceae bacterium]|jgi:outer membrane protein OmpA-like peptidoglycan-associated protein